MVGEFLLVFVLCQIVFVLFQIVAFLVFVLCQIVFVGIRIAFFLLRMVGEFLVVLFLV